MKKLFKNLMLVAVAAMAFVACSQEGNEVNILTKETTFEFTAGFNEDTRSGFGEKEGDAYPSVWHGGESIIAIFSNEDGIIGTANSSIDDLGEGVESSKTATFTVKYEGSLPDNYSVTFYSGSWNTNYETGEAYYSISDNQSCTDTSVESSNHLCKTEAIEVVNGEISTLNLTFNTATAFGKVTMEQFSDVTDKISEVKVTINGDTTYTVTPNALTKPVVWFACEAIESVTSLIVEAKVDGVTYIKTKEDIAEGALSFNTGRIRPINVKDMTEKPADYTFAFDSCVAINAYEGYWGGENYYAFKFTNSNNNQEWYLGFSAEDITNDTLPIGTFEVTNNMEQGKVYGNGSFLLNIDEFNNEYPTYLTEGTVTISENEGVYNVLAKVKAYVNGSRTIDISFEGTIAEPEPPTFTSATYTGGGVDKIIKLYGEELGELWINFYGNNPLITSENCINVGQYSIGNGLFFGGTYGQYKPAGYSEWCTSTPNSFTVDVSIVDGQYKFVVNADYNNWDEGVTLVNAVYHGDIKGLDYPDLRTKLATPVVTTTISGKTITMNWNVVENAESYYIKCTSDQDFEPISTTDTTVTITVSAYEYHSFSIKAVVSDDNEIYRSSDEAYVEYNDPREELPSPSNVTATIDGPNATISWDAVDGADSYQVSYWLNEQKRIDVDGTSITLEVGYDVSNLWVSVFSIANDDNLEYRSSTSWDASVEVNTGKDPNVFADHILDKVTVKSDHIEFYREYVGDGTQHSANTTESLRIYLHANNRGNDYISTGEYTCVGAGASVPPSAGTVNMRYTSDSYWYYHSNANTNSTLSVSFVNNEYVIIATINGETWGYKGMPQGWSAPGGGDEPGTGEGGGDEPGTGEGSGDEPDGTVNNPYVFTNCTYAPGQYVQLHFSGSEDGAELTLESNTGYGLPEGVVSLSNNGWWYSGHSYSLGDINYGSSYTSIDKNADGSYKINYIMINSNGKNTYYIYNENIL